MDLNDLSAAELSKIDAVCLQYERLLREGNEESIESVLSRSAAILNRVHLDLLRKELQAVREEVTSAQRRLIPDRQSNFGDKIGPYIITGVLGEGGMGVVYSAIDARLDRKVAMKMLNSDGNASESIRQRFEREARAVASLTHPNIVELFDVGLSGNAPYAVMELLEGETLDIFLSHRKLTEDEVRHIGAQIADALDIAHKTGVVHRDLKPQNVMVTRRADLFVKLFDFGLSRSDGSLFTDETNEKTREGVVMGTPGYMAPEQARGEQAGYSADLFSFGCVLFEAFYGRPAFEGATATARYASTLEQSPSPDPIRRRDDIQLADLIDECLSKEVGKRPLSAADVAKRLRQRAPVMSPVEQSVQSGYAAGVFVRRRFAELIGGGVLGGLLGTIAFESGNETLSQIHSLGVLSFTNFGGDPSTVLINASGEVQPDLQGQPMGDQPIYRGDQIAALIVNELSRLKDVRVTPFRPLIAGTPQEFREIGSLLEVDALVTGSLRTVQRGEKQFDEIELQIVSARSGTQLWGQTFVSPAGESLLEQSRFATELAAAVGRSLTATKQQLAPPDLSAFKCLVDGSARSDPDSTAGLRMALECFESAHNQDERFAQPLAGMSLTSIVLAAQVSTEESIALIQQARNSAADAKALDKKSIDARLADAMLMWQTLYRFEEAKTELSELLADAPNYWLVRHQLGLLELTMGNSIMATKFLREATQLNPHSVIAKLDQARMYWMIGNLERAIVDAKRIRLRHLDSRHARGLLIDLYEQQEDFALAAREHEDVNFGEPVTHESYFSKRSELDLDRYPYGPFGNSLNKAILQSRLGDGVDDLTLGELADSTPPMLPLLLSSHPAFASAKLLDRAKEIL